MKKKLDKFKNSFLIYTIPILVIFIIVLLAYWPGILVSDSMVQWHQTQTGNISNWHPAYNTIYIMLLTKIINNPGFVLGIQCLIMSLCIGSFLKKIEKYYNVNKIYLIVSAVILALIPLNYNSAVILLKDSLYSVLLILLSSKTIDIINEGNYFKSKKNVISLILLLIIIMLFRHNGILTIGIYSLVLILIYRKQWQVYLIAGVSIFLYFMLTTVGFKVLDIKEGNYANKYGPISHIFARILNEDKSRLDDEELKELSKYVDIEQLESTYNQYNMDYSINSQKVDELKLNGDKYIKLAIDEFIESPWIFFKHYIYLDSFLYSPYAFDNAWVVGMFIETDLWVYSDQYPELNENSKIPGLLPKLKEMSFNFQDGKLNDYTMRPAWYLYITIIASIVLAKIYKSKKIYLIGLVSLANVASIAVAMPVAMTRYVYSTILLGYLFIIWIIYEIYRKIRSNKKTCNNLEYIKKGSVTMEIKNKKIAILIPCYNESKTIEKVVNDYKKALPEADIYVYDNNSTDDTDKIAKKAGAIVKYEYKQGKGNVIRSMFREIEADCYLMIDGDDTYPAEDARKMCNLVLEGKADMVIGDRLSSTYFTENKRAFHNFGNRIVRFFINKIFKNNIKDIMTGYRAFSYDFVKGFPVLSKGFEIETEMTIHAVDKNYKLVEIPVTYRDRPEGSVSKLNTISDGIKVLKTIGTLFKEYKPSLFFNIIALVSLLVSLVLGIPVLTEYFNTGLVPRFPSLIVSMILLAISILMWITGIILQVINKKHKQLYELYMNLLVKNSKEK